MTEAKYQYSIGKPGGEIFVIRADNYDEWVLAIEQAKSGVLVSHKVIEEAVGEQTFEAPTKLCAIHNMKMEQKWSEKKQKHYWAHTFNGDMCFGHKN